MRGGDGGAGGRKCVHVRAGGQGGPFQSFSIHTHPHTYANTHSTQMIGVKYPSVRELRWTNDSLRCLLELHDNSILLTKRETKGRVRWD